MNLQCSKSAENPLYIRLMLLLRCTHAKSDWEDSRRGCAPIMQRWGTYQNIKRTVESRSSLWWYQIAETRDCGDAEPDKSAAKVVVDRCANDRPTEGPTENEEQETLHLCQRLLNAVLVLTFKTEDKAFCGKL